jgi:hypothetical protein
MEKGWVLTSTKAVPSFSAVLKSAGNRFSIACLRRRGVIREASRGCRETGHQKANDN